MTSKRTLRTMASMVMLTAVLFTLQPTTSHAVNQIRLNAKYHRQEKTLSCEVASLKMALSAVGMDVPESDLRGKLPYDRTIKRFGIWGDPYAGFVGSIAGRMMVTGYGVYWEPIARVGLAYRRTETIVGADLQTLTKHLDEGRPVIVWGYYGSGAAHAWQTPTGRTINAISGEHARVVIGYTGDSKNPETFTLLDPLFGELTWRWDELWQNWSALERGAVVVYPQHQWVKLANDGTVWEISKDGKTRHGLAISWEKFLARGGLPEGIGTVTDTWLQSLAIGPMVD